VKAHASGPSEAADGACQACPGEASRVATTLPSWTAQVSSRHRMCYQARNGRSHMKRPVNPCER
jgi:hypothetical protein